jgi:transaldolase
MVETTVTDYWNDSCSVSELSYAIEHGAVGATSNPTIVLNVLKKEMPLWKARIFEIIAANPSWSEVEIAWQVIEELAITGAALLEPIYERQNHKKGLLSIQTNPANYRSTEAIVEQALHFHQLTPNFQIKIPATAAGIQAIEEVTAHGISINATVSFTVSQALAVAEAVDRGLKRWSASGGSITEMSPVCTIMAGRVDDWLQAVITRDNLILDPAAPVWSGVAVTKRAYQLYQERGYHTRLLVAAYRHHLHWSEFIGGDLALSMPYEWQKRFNASDIEVRPRMQNPVDPAIVDDLYRHIPDFRKAYDPDGLTIPEFDTYGATVRTLRGFISSYHDLLGLIRDEFMLRNPDVRQS